MKRSEMRKHLFDVFDKFLVENTGSTNLVDVFLDACLEKGMQPPVYYPYSCSCSMTGSCPACNLNEYKMYNRWEPET